MRRMGDKGLTLIEVLGAMAILSFVVLGVIAISHFSAFSSAEADLRSEAQIIAESRLAALRADPSSYAVPGIDTDGRYTIYYEIHALPSGESAAVTINSIPISQSNKLSLQGVIFLDDGFPYLLTVTVAWEGVVN